MFDPPDVNEKAEVLEAPRSVSRRDEKNKEEESTDWLEVSATVLLGIAAVLIAWSTYQAQLWGGVQDTRNTASAVQIVDAADDLGRADATRSLDQLLFGDWILKPDGLDSDTLFGQMSAAGQRASNEWLSNDALRPFDGDAYTAEIYGEGLTKRASAFALFDAASEANNNGDDYTLAATVAALVLFLCGVSLVLRGRMTRTILVVGSGAILVAIAGYLSGLPQHSDAATEAEITDAATENAAQELAAQVPVAEEPAVDEGITENAVVDEPVAEMTAPPANNFVPIEGGVAFAVYLDYGDASYVSDDPLEAFAPFDDQFTSEGYAVDIGDMICDQGAADYYGLGEIAVGEYFAAKIYFATYEDAIAFNTKYYPEFESDEGVIAVQTFCLE